MSNRFGIGVRIDGHDVAPHVFAGGEIDYGRNTVNEQPGAPTAQLTLFTREGNQGNPSSWFDYGVGAWGDPSGFATDHDDTDDYAGPRTKVYIGAPVWISATTKSGFAPGHDTTDAYDGFESRRFTGKVQAIEYSWYQLHLTCAAPLEDWARVGIIDAPSVPIEEQPDSERAAELAYRTPSPTTLHIEGGPGPAVIELKTDAYPVCLLPALLEMADDADALLYCNREGNVIYQTRDWTPPAYWSIPPGIIDAESIDMTLELGDIENDIHCEYGEPGTDAGVRYVTNVPDIESMARYGTRTNYYAPQLLNSGDAYLHARTIINRTAPGWHLPNVDLMMKLATDREVLDACALDQNHHVTITGLPAGAPVPTYQAKVLGWTETLDSDDWVIQLHLAPDVYPYHEES